MGDSMWSSMSMTSSMQLAQECLKQDNEEEKVEASNSLPFEGPELLAQTIESGKKLPNKCHEIYKVHPTFRIDVMSQHVFSCMPAFQP